MAVDLVHLFHDLYFPHILALPNTLCALGLLKFHQNLKA
jgi:hypothetical protein